MLRQPTPGNGGLMDSISYAGVKIRTHSGGDVMALVAAIGSADVWLIGDGLRLHMPAMNAHGYQRRVALTQ